MIKSIISKNKWLRVLSNKYVLIGSFFFIWIIFLDDASLKEQIYIDRDISQLKKDRDFYKEKLQKVRRELEKVQRDPKAIEKIAREKFFMKKKDEDIFIVVEEKE